MVTTLHWIALAQNMGIERIIMAGFSRHFKEELSLFVVRAGGEERLSYSVSSLIDSRSSFFSPILIQLSTRSRGESIVHTRDRVEARIYDHEVFPCVFNANNFL